MSQQHQLFDVGENEAVVRHAKVISMREAVRARAASAWAPRLAGVLSAEQISTLRAALLNRRVANLADQLRGDDNALDVRACA